MRYYLGVAVVEHVALFSISKRQQHLVVVIAVLSAMSLFCSSASHIVYRIGIVFYGDPIRPHKYRTIYR